LNSNCSNLLDMRNLQEQVKKAFCYQELFWPFTVWINCSSDLKIFTNSRPSASNIKSFSRSLEQFFLTVGQNNFGNKIPFSQNIREYYDILSCKLLKKSCENIGNMNAPSKKMPPRCSTNYDAFIFIAESCIWRKLSVQASQYID
jgi:hypothetical protein